MSGWQASFLPDSSRGKVSGWSNAANLGGGAFGSMLVLELAEKLPLKVVALVFASLCLLPVLLLLALPSPARPALGASRVFTATWQQAWEACRKRDCLIGFALFLSPASCVAAINLFSGLGNDFHADPQRVIWVTGAGCAIAGAIGSVVGGFVADRVNRGCLYLVAGIGAAVCGLGMAFSGHTVSAFTYGVLAYNLAAGVAYAAFTAIALQLVGAQNPVASTVMGLFAAAANGAVVYMTWVDGLGYRYFGLGGLLGVDAGLSFVAAIPLLLLVRRGLRRAESPAPAPQAALARG